MAAQYDDPWSYGPVITQPMQPAPTGHLTCSFCAAENHAAATRCGACNVEFADWPPLEWATSQREA